MKTPMIFLFEDVDLFNPLQGTESRYTSQSAIIAIDIESLLQPSNIVAEVIKNLCLACSTQLNVYCLLKLS
jgi:hypothetical protein